MRILIFLLALLLLATNVTSASNPANVVPALFHDDLSRLDCEMAELSLLETLVEETKVTRSQLVEANNPLVKQIAKDDDISGALLGSTAPEHEQMLGIPGFLWGFCCSAFGVLLVFLSIDDPAARKKEGAQALIGCAAGTVLWIGLYIWFIISLATIE